MKDFQKGNKAAAKNPKIVLRKFREMLENAKKDDNILCFQDACASINWRDSKVAYWCNKLSVFETFKKDIQNVIISRINRESLRNNFNSTASIWRQKQLGERDQQYQELTGRDGKDLTPAPTLTSSQLDKLIDKL